MILVEVLTGGATLSAGQQEQVAAAITTGMLGIDGGLDRLNPEARRSVEGALSLTAVTFTQPPLWMAGGEVLDGQTPRRYVVRVWVPEAWHGDTAAHAVQAVTRALATVEDDPGRLEHDPHAWVHVLAVPESGCGVLGRQATSSDLVRLVTARTHDGPATEPPPGSVLDPVCGMVVRLDDRALTLDHEGVTYGFCAEGCRRVFAEDHDIALSA